MWTLFLLSSLLTAQPQQSSGSAAAISPQVQVIQERAAAFLNAPDMLELTLMSSVQLTNGRRVGMSVRPAVGTEPWFVYSRANLCQSVITHGPAPADATEGWKVTVVERSRAGRQVTIGVTWSRVLERGRPIANGSGGTSELLLQPNDRIPLDTITRPSDPAACPGTTKSLEIQVGANASAPVPAGESPLDGVVDAELWMVHTMPSGVEIVEHQVVRLVNGVIGFAFRGAPVETSGGQVAIELSGQLKAVKRDDGSRGLWAALTRGVTSLSTGVTRINGPSTTTVAWPTATDVVQIDLPPLEYSATRAGGGGGGRGGGGAGVSVAAPRSSGTGTSATGGQAAGGGAGAGGLARGTGGAVIAGGGRGAAPGPNLLEGHRLSLRVRLAESPR